MIQIENERKFWVIFSFSAICQQRQISGALQKSHEVKRRNQFNFYLQKANELFLILLRLAAMSVTDENGKTFYVSQKIQTVPVSEFTFATLLTVVQRREKTFPSYLQVFDIFLPPRKKHWSGKVSKVTVKLFSCSGA